MQGEITLPHLSAGRQTWSYKNPKVHWKSAGKMYFRNNSAVDDMT